MIEEILRLIQFMAAFILLSIASWQDVKTREVADWIWMVMIGGGILIHIMQILFLIANNESIISYLTIWIINIIFSFTLALFLNISGLGGEADRIAFLALGIILPISLPIIILFSPRYEILFVILPRIFGIFCNAYLFALPVPFFIFGFNVINQLFHPDIYSLKEESVWIKIAIRFIGFPHHTRSLRIDLKERPWHYDFLEEFDEKSGWKINFRTRLDTPENDIIRKNEIISTIESTEKKYVWIQPSLPFIFILMVGYLVEILIGNVLLILMSFFF